MFSVMYGTETIGGQVRHTAAFADEHASDTVKSLIGFGDDRTAALTDLWNEAREHLAGEELASAYHGVKSAGARLRNELVRKGATA